MVATMELDITSGNFSSLMLQYFNDHSFFSKPGCGDFVSLNQIIVAQKLFNQNI